MVVTFRAGDKLERGTIPTYDDPAIEGLWDEVVAGIKRIMKEQNWSEDILTFGISDDTTLNKRTTAFFAKQFPAIQWAGVTHDTPLPAPLTLCTQYAPISGFQMNKRGWKEDMFGQPLKGYYLFCLQRGDLDVNSRLTAFRYSPICSLLGGMRGPGGNGLDRWVDKATGRLSVNWHPIGREQVMSVLAPGPDGPVATERYEAMRAGFQEAQAIIYVDDNAGNPKLPAPLAARAKAMADRWLSLFDLHFNRSINDGWETEVDNLYRTAADMQAIIGDTP